MSKFIYNIFSHLILIIGMFLILFVLVDDEKKWNKDFWSYNSEAFQTKKKYFEEMSKQKRNINLLLGSSHMHRGVIPDSLGKNWFSFTNGSQTLYDSYKFLKYYSDSVKIDTIIISVAPFDFAKTYLNSNFNFLPNGNFITFGVDSISEFSHNLNQKAHLHKLKTKFFPNIFKLFSLIKKRVIGLKHYSNSLKNPTIHIKGEENSFISKQGYVYNPKKADQIENVDFLISTDDNFRKNTIKIVNMYFTNISDFPNMSYFDLFNSFCIEKKIEVIYLYPPSIKYFRKESQKKYFGKWELIKRNIEEKNVIVWNYESFNDTNKFEGFFYDATHLSYNGARKFSLEIKQKLYNEK